jgi:hypothetical protein
VVLTRHALVNAGIGTHLVCRSVILIETHLRSTVLERLGILRDVIRFLDTALSKGECVRCGQWIYSAVSDEIY